MTSTGPLVLSGFEAGVSVEGPMASVSARFKAVGGAGFADEEGAAGAFSGAMASTAGGADVAIAACAGASAVWVAVFAGAAPATEAWRVLISTGLEDRASLLLWGRDDEAAGCGVLCGPVGGCSAVDAMVGRLSVAMQSGKRASCERPNEWLTRTQAREKSNVSRHRRGEGEKQSERERERAWETAINSVLGFWVCLGRSSVEDGKVGRPCTIARCCRCRTPRSPLLRNPQSTHAATTIRRLR